MHGGGRLAWIFGHLIFFSATTAVGVFVLTSDTYMLRMVQLGITSAIFQGSKRQNQDEPAMRILKFAKQ